MTMPADFDKECLYAPDAWFVHEVVSVDRDGVRARTDTTRLGPLVEAQRVWPGHPKHFPGAVAIQITGVLGHLHAVYGLDLRSTEGWVGFGTHIKSAKFPTLGVIGPWVDLEARATKVRNIRGTVFSEYEFTYRQEGRVIYESVQTAAWVNPRPKADVSVEKSSPDSL